MIVRAKRIIKQLAGIVLLVIFTQYVISYTNYGFEIPFFIRQKPNSDVDNELSYTDNRDSSEVVIQTTEDINDLNNLHKIVNPDDLIEKTDKTENINNTDVSDYESANSGDDEIDAAETPIFPSVEELKARGYYITDGVYKKYSSENLNATPIYEYNFALLTPEYENLPKARVISTSTDNFYAIETAMDFLLIRDSDNLILCDSSGKIIAEHLDFKIVKGRDENNMSVLANIHSERNGEELTEVTRYFIYDKGMKSFIQSTYNPIYGDRGVPFMYPSYYGANGASNLSRYENNGKWGYYNYGTEASAIAPEYDMAYNFSENIGIAYKIEQKGNWRDYYYVRKLYFLDEQGKVINSSYYAPDEITANHLGFFYFDNGLTRVHLREFDNQGRTTIEKDILVDKSGKEFYVPEDYAIKAYSNGTILLEKDKYYGFMNYNGDWIAQPIFKYAQPFYEGVAVVGLENGKKALIDTNGNLIVKFNYDYISNCSGGLIALYEKDEGWTILAKMREDK